MHELVTAISSQTHTFKAGSRLEEPLVQRPSPLRMLQAIGLVFVGVGALIFTTSLFSLGSSSLEAFLVLLMLTPAAVMIARRSTAQLLVLIALSPLVVLPPVSAAMTAAQFARGNARLHIMGMLSDPDSLDPELDCRPSSHGCCPTGTEVFWMIPANATLRLLTRTLGPQSNGTEQLELSPDQIQHRLRLAERLDISDAISWCRARDLKLNECLLDALFREDSGSTWRVFEAKGSLTLVASARAAALFDPATGKSVATFRRPTETAEDE